MVKKKTVLIQDTSAPPMMLDLEAKDDDQTIEALLNMQREKRDNRITISFRIHKDELQQLQRLARQISSNIDKNVHYQDLIRNAYRIKYFKKTDEYKRSTK